MLRSTQPFVLLTDPSFLLMVQHSMTRCLIQERQEIFLLGVSVVVFMQMWKICRLIPALGTIGSLSRARKFLTKM
jgi:hypothetical protein